VLLRSISSQFIRRFPVASNRWSFFHLFTVLICMPGKARLLTTRFRWSSDCVLILSL